MKNLIKIKNVWFTKNCTRYKKMLGNKILHLFITIYKFSVDYLFAEVIYFLLFTKNVFIKIKNSIFLPKYTGYGKNVK